MIGDTHERFSRVQWAALAAATSPTTAGEPGELHDLAQGVTADEAREVYLPLVRLVRVRRDATPDPDGQTGKGVGAPPRFPFVVAIAGSVAVGKSTFARALAALLGRWPERPKVEVVAADGFLLSNAELERRGLSMRKGFPESYDVGALVTFLASLKRGDDAVEAPVYSHATYDVVPGVTRRIERPDILVLEGVNVLHAGDPGTGTGADSRDGHTAVASDFFDVSIYLDADEAVVRTWYVERFLALREAAAHDEASFFARFSALSDDEARAVAVGVWDSINGPNLRDNIVPTRGRADVVVHKALDHRVDWVALRRA